MNSCLPNTIKLSTHGYLLLEVCKVFYYNIKGKYIFFIDNTKYLVKNRKYFEKDMGYLYVSLNLNLHTFCPKKNHYAKSIQFGMDKCCLKSCV